MIELYHGDCLNILKDMPDNHIDVIVTDPNYGIGEAAGKNKSRGSAAKANKWKGSRNTTGASVPATQFKKMEWDNKRPSPIYFKEMLRVSKHQIIFGGNYFADLLPPSSCWIVWDKKNGETDFADCELAWTSFKTAVRIFKYRWNGMLQGNMRNKEKRVHPTQKPLPLGEWLVSNYTKEGDLIADFFMGSGTFGEAAINFKRSFIGVEKEKEYFDKAKERIEDADNQINF
jgi:site-specific DNA-methyltransferase (adenine-specific)